MSKGESSFLKESLSMMWSFNSYTGKDASIGCFSSLFRRMIAMARASYNDCSSSVRWKFFILLRHHIIQPICDAINHIIGLPLYFPNVIILCSLIVIRVLQILNFCQDYTLQILHFRQVCTRCQA